MKNSSIGLFATLASVAFFILACAAVWMGGLNQDEGWYLYAANLVSDGQLPYRDFFFTQGPMLPIVYSAFSGIWKNFGILGARILTLAFGSLSIVFAMAIAYRLAPEKRRSEAALMTALLLGCNLYHLYYLAIPKTYALSSLFVLSGLYLVVMRHSLLGAFALALAAGTRLSLGAILPVVGLALLISRQWKQTFAFAAGGAIGLALVYGPFILDARALGGLVAAQKYHAARGGFDLMWIVGSLSRLVRWYLPVFIVLGLGIAGLALGSGAKRERMATPFATTMLVAFLAVFAVQMLAPFPYEDYQVPVMGLVAVYAVVAFVSTSTSSLGILLVLGLAFATSFGSPLLERWSVNGQDRFWSIKKDKTELAQLRDVAAEIEMLDPGGRELLTQDTYLAIETGRKVPKGLEMGPFSILTDDEWRALLDSAPCAVAALSGYTFAIEPPVCNERPLSRQMEYWSLLKKRYELVSRENGFGQNSTTLLILKRK